MWVLILFGWVGLVDCYVGFLVVAPLVSVGFGVAGLVLYIKSHCTLGLGCF